MNNTNQVRIIGGTHRGRRITFPHLSGLRPTGDRMRETLFNWLQPTITGASCLDLFAGSGALGIEAASRGAGQVIMLDLAPIVIQHLWDNVRILGLPQIDIIHAEALQWLQECNKAFDIVFLDPPFATDLTIGACNLLLQHQLLNDQALVYLERSLTNQSLAISDKLTLIRERRMGQVWCGLARYDNIENSEI